MPKKSAGILAYRWAGVELQVLLVHPGGPFWARKDAGAWSIPKGEFSDDEDPLAAAKREMQEELGVAPDGKYVPLTPIRQKSGKQVYAWAVETNIDTEKIVSNTFAIEWPPASGKMKEFPEIDKAEWYSLTATKEKINPAQFAFVAELQQLLTG
ncbi:MAG: NUDIX domain-containing protein [Flavipsychrobacter sp.]